MGQGVAYCFMVNRITQLGGQGLDGIRRRPIWSAVITVAVVFAAGFGLMAWSASNSLDHVLEAADDVMRVGRQSDLEKTLTPDGYADLLERVHGLEGELRSLRTQTGVLAPLSLVPGVGDRLFEGRRFLDMSLHTATAARLVLQAYTPAVQVLHLSPRSRDLRTLESAMATASPQLAEARSELEAAEAARRELQDVESLGSRATSAVQLYDRYVPFLELAVVLGREHPEVVTNAIAIKGLIEDLRSTLDDPKRVIVDAETVEEDALDLAERTRLLRTGIEELEVGLDPSLDEVGLVLRAVASLAAVVEEMGRSLVTLSGLARNVLEHGLLSEGAGEEIRTALPELSDSLEATDAKLEEARSVLADDQLGDESPVLPLLRALVGDPSRPLVRETGLMERAGEAMAFLDYALGRGEPRTLLLVGQNPEEIRATGGFLGVAAELTIEEGELVNLEYIDSTQVDKADFSANPVSPEPIYRYLWISRLLFRDSNWNPHFPSSAARIADMYARGLDVQVDGVIATTEDLALDLVEALGGVRVPEVPRVLDRETAERYVEGEIRYPCRPEHVVQRGKRCFDQDLFTVLLDRLMHPMERERLEPVLDVLFDALDTKDLMIHVFDQDAASILWSQDWNGPLEQVDHDYLMAVDTSLPGHARSIVQRTTQYEVSLDPGGSSEATLRLTYTHKGTKPDPHCTQGETSRTGCFWNYLRVYIPVGVSDLHVPPIPAPESSLLLIWGYEPVDTLSVISSPREGLTSFTEIGGYILVEPGHSVTLVAQYDLPPSVIRNLGGGRYEYRLLVQKQPGTPDEPVSVFVELPRGAVLEDASPGGATIDGRWVRMDAVPETDVLFKVQFRSGG